MKLACFKNVINNFFKGHDKHLYIETWVHDIITEVLLSLILSVLDYVYCHPSCHVYIIYLFTLYVYIHRMPLFIGPSVNKVLSCLVAPLIIIK